MTRVCNKCRCVKELEDFPVQKGCKEGRRPTCKPCMALKTAAWRAEDPERAKESQRGVKLRNTVGWYEKERARTKRYKDKNRETVREAGREYSRNNPHIGEKYYRANRAKVIARSAAWAKNNPEKARVNGLRGANKRRAAKLNATPEWADMASISWVYAMSVEINLLTDVAFDVDHIIPLQGKLVCGLHVADNLRIIEAAENRSKGRRFDPEEHHER